MADSTNPSGNKSISANLLPRYYRTDANKKFLQATVDQLIQPGTVKKINGYIGRQNAKSATGDDIYITAPTADRQNYQLEPGLVIKDDLGNNTFFKDYQDYINQLGVFGANTKNHARLNEQEMYSWDPHINWDKFSNFQNYYWLPYGPDVIKITGQAQGIESTYTVNIMPEADNNTYVFFPNTTAQLENPTIKLYRGQSYRFEISSVGNPFSIKTKRTAGKFDRYLIPGITGQAIEEGVIQFTVPYNSPDILYYVSEKDANLGGVFEILSIDENTTLDVNAEIIGKKYYTLPDGTKLSNGMKVSFVGQVLPAEYRTGQYYVEGVGDAIQLINESILELVSSYTASESIAFDSTPFDSMPWSDATTFAGVKDYVVINRGSFDHNPWSRYNRWFHKDVIEASAAYNGKIANIDETARATRAIIEFEPNIRLYNFGTEAIADVDLIDTYTTDVMSNVEGQIGYNIDGVALAQGQRILFTNDTDVRVKNKIYKVDFLILDGERRIHLLDQGDPVANQVALIKQGLKNQGLMYWYNGTNWLSAQQKLTVNQAPLFDIVDDSGYSYGDKTVYDGSTFAGTRLFSYKVGTGTNDSVLGFPLTYKNINNVGDIVFNFNIATDSFQYKSGSNIVSGSTNVGYLVKTLPDRTEAFVNGWQKTLTKNLQSSVRIYRGTTKVNNFDIDLFEDINQLDDLVVKVYLNGDRLYNNQWSIVNGGYYKKLVLTTDITASDILTIRCYASQPINAKGYYEIPYNLQNNPLNNEIGDFTLGEVSNHVNSMIGNLENFEGIFPGSSNLRDLGNVTPYGTRFVQHSGPISLSLYHITSENNNVIRALEQSRDDYNKFKRNFITVAKTLGVLGDPVKQVNLILQEINKDKPKTFPYYFSDMVPYNGSIRTDLTVIDYRIKTYPLTNTFTLDTLSSKAVLVYLNGEQLLYKKDYTFNSQGFIVVSATIANGDAITIYEFENTNGCFVPQTPTKLGIWPKYEPKIYLDTSLVTPRTMIQGHDGSQTLAYGDYRDELILELEKRIYNNIKIEYDPNIFDIHDIVPAYNRGNAYTLKEFNEVLASNFYKWVNVIDRDFTKPLSYNSSDSLTFNYKDLSTPDGQSPLPGYWKGIYRWMLDTDRPNLTPWEMLGFSEEPSWWQEQYGPAPYTRDNLIMWDDLADGIVRQPGVPPVQLTKYVRPYLKNRIPVDEYGNVQSPLLSGLANGIITNTTAGDFVFGDVSPVESAWRRSSYYPFSMLLTFMLLQPSKAFGVLLDRSRIVRNKAGQLIYKDTGLRIKPADIALPSIYSSTTDVRTSGIINYIVDYIISDNLKSYNQYAYDLANIEPRLSHRISGFTSKEKFKLLLDSKTPLTSGSVFVPQEDYEIVLNSSSPIKKINYSAVIVTKFTDGFGIKGYSTTQPFFKYYDYTKTGIQINVGGISESYVTWAPRSQYSAGKVVAFGNRYYRAKTLHTTTEVFNPVYYELLPKLPIIGGVDAYLRQGWDRTTELTVPYGTKFRTVQEVVDFLVGYGEYLKDQGFVFDEFNTTLGAITNWETSAKEFLFWTTQNWSAGEDKWEDWRANQPYKAGTIVRYNGDYFQSIRLVEPTDIFNEEDYARLDGLSSVGSAVISLSPSANKLTFSTPLCIVDDIRNPFNGYEIFKVDGTQLQPNFLNNYREDNTVSYTPIDDGIYGATFYLVQKEQVVILKNTTLFNDTIYSPESGYRQERIKVAGYVSSDWKGDFNIPGFIFDQAVVQEWDAWKDYALGDIVKYKQFYYSAKTFIAGTQAFDANDWIKLDSKPEAKLLPNWTYKATQFTDFYSLDSDNFDASQQEVAQHLIGYQKRQYLSNIIQDDVSEFKFYQGMIVEKGTQNVLNKLFDVLSADGQESIKFYEEWALRVGQYGANQAFENIEFVIDEATLKSNPQGFELVNVIEPGLSDFITRQTPNDVYLKPIGYNSAPFPTVSTYTPYLRTPGYVRSNEVKLTLKTIDDILTQDVSSFLDGEYVWVGFEGREWNVYRYTNLQQQINNIEYTGTTLEIELTADVENVTPGSVIAIDQATDYTGFYKVKDVVLKKIIATATFKSQPKSFADQARATIAILNSQRFASINDLSLTQINDGELAWTDDSGDGKWATWKFTPAFAQTELTNSAPANGLAYGRRVLLSDSGTIAISSTGVGDLIVFDRTGLAAPWLQRQTITAPFISRTEGFGYTPTPDAYTGDVIAISADSQWLASGTPRASNVSSKFKGHWNVNTSYDIGTVVLRNGQPYKAVVAHFGHDPLVTATTYTDLAGATVIGAGYGATFTIVSNKGNYTATITNSGSNYKVGDTIRITGNLVGGAAPTNNVVLTVVSIVNGDLSGPIANVSVTGNAKVFWNSIPYIPVDADGSNSNGFENQGVISIYKKDANNIFSLVATMLSPNPTANEKFGSSLVFGDNELFVGAEGYNNNTGIIYRVSYQSIVITATSYNPLGSSGTTVALSSTAGILPGLYLKGNGFASNQYVATVNSTNNTVVITAAPDTAPNGIINFVDTSWRYDVINALTETLPSDSGFGKVLDMTSDNSVLIAAAPGRVTDGKVFVYKVNPLTGDYVKTQTIVGQDEQFGSSLSISNDGEYLAISSVLADGTRLDQGAVYVYKLVNGQYVCDPANNIGQLLTTNTPEVAGFFGSKVLFMNGYETLVIYSQGADNYTTTTFNKNGVTTFDNNLTKFKDRAEDSGRVDVYDRYNTKWVFGESLANSADGSSGYSSGLAVGANQILVGTPYVDDQGYRSGKIYSYRKTVGTYSWTILHKENNRVDLTKIKKAFLYNKVTNKLISYLDVIDSNQGKIPGVADQEIKYKTFYDPATYSSGNTTVNVDDGMAWTKSQVGALWWDLRTAKFFDSHDESLIYRNSNWNSIFPGASIDIYEWVETKLTPDQWNALADTEEGIAVGVSGTSLYDNTVYSVVRKYDNVSKTFKNTYYYWVKNKKTVPNIVDRKLSAQDVVDLIENPRGYGYRYLALTGNNSFSLVNVKSLLEDKNVVLSIEYWTSPYTDKNIHSEWKIINNNSSTQLPTAIENKWFDSLCGKDEAGRVVPDPALPAKLKYGIEVRPRQSMFVNRFEALKQFIEQVNLALRSQLIVESRDITKLESFEAEPSTITGLYDSTLDTDAELRFANIGTYGKPTVTPIIVDGRITGIDIVERGSGYLVAPYIEIIGSGTGAVVRSILDSRGRVVGATVISSGYGYDNNTIAMIRNYSVLIHSDSIAEGAWSIYTYEPSTLVWSRVQSQSYDVRKYWSYADWYATGYNEFTAVDHSVTSMVSLTDAEVTVGQLVKVRTTSLGTWMLLEKYADVNSIDWTQSYKVIGREKGTIQFSSNLYDFANSPYGFDSTLYDSGIFDNSAAKELRIILNTLQNNILIDELRQTYLDLFFSNIRYAYSEQNYIDWVFKTSFVKAQHSVGELKQKVTYNNDNLSNFEDYINEVKPYRTKIREYVSAYNKTDTNALSTTDFDIPPVYENGSIVPINTIVKDGVILADNNKITQYPWKHWYDNAGYQVASLEIVDGGSGYLSEPTVRFSSNTGSGATARAFITNGRVTRIVLLTKGSGYLSTPTVIIDGGLSDSGTAARVVAIIGNGVVRNNTIKMKFDRTSQKYFITNLEETESFVGTGSRLQFPLKWAPDVRIGKSTVLIKGVETLRSSYKLKIVKSTTKGYTSYSGSITFDVAPDAGIAIEVTYVKDWSLLNAADRIQYFYEAGTGELGKDLAQLMTGVDYGGVNIYGMNFDVGSGWDSVPYYSDKWASFDTTFDDYIVTVAADTHDFVLPYVPADGTEMNVYYVGKNVNSYTGDGYTEIYNFDVTDVFPPSVVVSTTRNTSIINTAGGSILTLDNTTGIEPGNVVSTYWPVGDVLATSATGNLVTVSSTDGIIIGEKIRFTGETFGGLSTTAQYYVLTKPYADSIPVVSVARSVNITVSGTAPDDICVFTGSINGTTLTVTTFVSGTIEINSVITGDGVLPNTRIIGGAGSIWTVNYTQVVALGTRLTVTSKTHTNEVTSLVSGTGSGMIVTITKTSNVATYTSANTVVTITNQGTGYTNGTKVKVLGTVFGGTTPANDLIITLSATATVVTAVEHGLADDQAIGITGTLTALDTDVNRPITVTSPTSFTYTSSTVGSVSLTTPAAGMVHCAKQISVGLGRGGIPVELTTATGQAKYETVNSFAYNTTVKTVVDGTHVEVDQIIFKDIQENIPVTFAKTLVDPTDCTINPNGTVFLVNPIPVGSTIDISAYTDPIRLDDNNYDTTGTAKSDLDTKKAELYALVSSYNALVDNKSTIENNLNSLTDQLYSLELELNSLNIILAGMDGSNPNYPSIVSQINILVNTSIPTVQGEIDTAESSLTSTNNAISANITARAVKQTEIDTAQALYDSLPPIVNVNAIMQTPVSDGVADNEIDPTYKTFSIPGTFAVYEGDEFIWRKSTSDGAIKPQEADYDTSLSGGGFLASNLTSATGLAADDIIVDGDGFVTPTTSPATEEVVPGQVVDSVAIKVYDRPSTGSANIKVDSYIADGVETEFLITQQPNSATAVIVKFTSGQRDANGVLSSASEIQTITDDYLIDYKAKKVVFHTAPPAGKLVSIFSFGFNGSNILDLDYFIGDGTTTEFVTKAPWVADVTYLLYINGLPAPSTVTPELFQTDASYESAGRIGVFFSVAPAAGDLINYVIVSGKQQTYSITKTERIQGDGSSIYALQNKVGDSLPLESKMIVRVGQKILKGPANSFFTIAGTRLNYNIDPAKFLPYSLSVTDIYVYADGKLLKSGVDYIVDLSGITVKINKAIRQKYLNKELVVSIRQGQEYTYLPETDTMPARIQFAQAYDDTNVIEVISSYRHDILNIQRTGVKITSDLALTPDTPAYYDYRALAGGVIKLDRAVIDDNYVWVIKNGSLLTPSVDFKLNEDRQSIKLALYPDPADEFTIITYGSAVLGTGISYMQFKDMLNRTHFKRLNANKRTTLVKDLHFTDTTIEVADASTFDLPSVVNNKPGIIEIRGERIEYFTLTSNTVGEGFGAVTTWTLGQLRRGTLGTGVSKVHREGAFVQDIGSSETIPYTETTITEQIKSDGSNIVPLTFVPTKSANAWTYDTGFESNIPAGYGQADEIEVFVGGYTIVPWASNVEYSVNDIVELGSYTYQCVTAHISSANFKTDIANWTFFVGNIRLKKKPYKVHNVNNAPDSPEGDVQLDAEFAVDGTSSQLRLTHPVDFGTRVTVIKRTLTEWDSTTNILEDDSKIARFLKAAPAVWYANIGKYENKAGTPTSFDSTNGTYDSTSLTWDQG